MFLELNEKKLIIILYFKMMEMIIHQLNGYVLYVGAYQQMLYMWGGKCDHGLLVVRFNFIVVM